MALSYYRCLPSGRLRRAPHAGSPRLRLRLAQRPDGRANIGRRRDPPMGLVQEFATAFNARDVNGLLACFTERASYTDNFYGEHGGRDGLRAMFERMFREGRDYLWRMDAVVETPTSAAAEWTFSYVVTDAVPRGAGWADARAPGVPGRPARLRADRDGAQPHGALVDRARDGLGALLARLRHRDRGGADLPVPGRLRAAALAASPRRRHRDALAAVDVLAPRRHDHRGGSAPQRGRLRQHPAALSGAGGLAAGRRRAADDRAVDHPHDADGGAAEVARRRLGTAGRRARRLPALPGRLRATPT